MLRISYLLIVVFFFSACKLMPRKDEKKKKLMPAATKQFFGFSGTDSVFRYILKNGKGMEAGIINYGGTVTDIIVPGNDSVPVHVVLGYDSLAGFLQTGNPYFGCLVGRYANRIANAQFVLDGKLYKLQTNNNGNTLHGGIRGFDKVLWSVLRVSDSSLTLAYLSPDGEEGFPGNLSVEVTYTLGRENELMISYKASTDRPTPVNLTSHCYFNLSGGKDSTILDHELLLDADTYTPVNEALIPTGKMVSVAGTPMDFRVLKKIGKELALVPGGYDHNWVLNKMKGVLQRAGVLIHPGSGIVMEFFTTEPGIQFYSGNFLDGTLMHSRNGQRYIRHAGLCLEAQHFPDSPNQPSFPATILRPGDTYQQTTVYRFGLK